MLLWILKFYYFVMICEILYVNVWSCSESEPDSCSDRIGFEAIRWLHQQLDDDSDGNVDISESEEFLRDELKYENGNERQKAFHGNDKHITVDELWKSWKSSEVRNWTVDETVEWLINSVELPQYVTQFEANAVDGMALPRLAANSHFLNILGINNAIHKQKIALKAMDVVLFGSTKRHNYFKDILLAFSLIIACGGCWFAYVQHTHSQSHLKKMMRDMDTLQRAEEQLEQLQQQLDKTRQEQQSVVMEKVNLEKKLKENENLKESGLSSEMSGNLMSDASKLVELEDELRDTREQLKRAENALSSRCYIPPQLQQWLQLTHEVELRSYNNKKTAAEMQLLSAKEGCEKLRKKRSTVLGAFRVAHGNSIDDVDNRILLAKSALSEITKDLQERLHRWRHIEMLCGFSVIQNAGLVHLETQLYGSPSSVTSPSLTGIGLTRTGSEVTIVDEEGMPVSTVEHLIEKSLSLMMSPASASASLPLLHAMPSKLFRNNMMCCPTNNYGDHKYYDHKQCNSRRESCVSMSSIKCGNHFSALPSNSIPNNDSNHSVSRRGSGVYFSPAQRANQDKSSMLSLNLNNASISPKSSTVMTPSSITSSITSSAHECNTDNEVEDEDIVSESTLHFTAHQPILNNATTKTDSQTNKIKLISNNKSFSNSKIIKSQSQDEFSFRYDSNKETKINHSESCSDLKSSSQTLDSFGANNHNRSNSDSPSIKTRKIKKHFAVASKKVEESSSTDSTSIKDSDSNKLPNPDWKRTFFGLKKRKTSKPVLN